MRVQKCLLLSALFLALPAWVSAQTGGSGAGTTGQGSTTGQVVQYQFPMQIYRMDNVSRTLNLTPDQVNRLNQISQQLQTRYQNDINNLRTLDEQARQQRWMELQQQYNTNWMNDARTIFNDQQLNRYRQLELQYNNFNSFTVPDVRTRLNLTDDQIRRLQEAQAWSRSQLQTIERQGMTNRDDATRAWQNYWTEVQTRTNQILTPQQQQLWRGMTGDPFTFQPTFAAPRGSGTTGNPPSQR
jgi:hypothetical protein